MYTERNLMAKCITFREKKYHFREQARTIGKSPIIMVKFIMSIITRCLSEI